MDKPVDWENLSKESVQFTADLKERDLSREVDRLKTRYDQSLVLIDTLRKRNAFLDKVDAATIKPYVIRPKHKVGTSETTPIFCLSDVHAYETVKPEEVNDRNEYNPEIARKSVTTYFSRAMALVDTHRHDTKIDECILWLGGDLMSGHIHDDQKLYNAGSPIEESLFVMRLLKGAIEFLQKEGKFKTITVVANVGNHSRTTEKPLAQGEVRNSYEYLLYKMLEKEYTDVNWVIAEGYFAFVDIYGFNTRFSHGSNLRYGGGVGGVGIPLNKAIAQWNKHIKADIDIVGHYHQLIWYGNWVMNGSVIGYNAYALKIKAGFEPPRQAVVFVGKGKGIRDVSSIYVR